MNKHPLPLTILTEEDEAFRATVNKALGYKGITCFIVERDQAGVTVGTAVACRHSNSRIGKSNGL